MGIWRVDSLPQSAYMATLDLEYHFRFPEGFSAIIFAGQSERSIYCSQKRKAYLLMQQIFDLQYGNIFFLHFIK